MGDSAGSRAEPSLLRRWLWRRARLPGSRVATDGPALAVSRWTFRPSLCIRRSWRGMSMQESLASALMLKLWKAACAVCSLATMLSCPKPAQNSRKLINPLPPSSTARKSRMTEEGCASVAWWSCSRTDAAESAVVARCRLAERGGFAVSSTLSCGCDSLGERRLASKRGESTGERRPGEPTGERRPGEDTGERRPGERCGERLPLRLSIRTVPSSSRSPWRSSTVDDTLGIDGCEALEPRLIGLVGGAASGTSSLPTGHGHARRLQTSLKAKPSGERSLFGSVNFNKLLL